MVETGLLQRFEKLHWTQHDKCEPAEQTVSPRPSRVVDVWGALVVLGAGFTAAATSLCLELTCHRYQRRTK